MRRTFTLSPESLALLEDLSVARSRSVSAVVDDLLKMLIAQRKRESVEQAITAYYDGLSPGDQAEERAWGEFSFNEFTKVVE